MDHLEYAIYRMAHDFEGGVTALAQRINVRPGTLIAKVDPANDAATTNVREAALLDAALDAGAAHGDLMARTRDALRDGEIDAQELAAIREAATASTMAAEQMVASAAAAAEATTLRRADRRPRAVTRPAA